MNNKNKGSVDLIGVVLMAFAIGLFVLMALAFMWEFNRFSAVDSAKTSTELESACKAYNLASLRNIPVACLKFYQK